MAARRTVGLVSMRERPRGTAEPALRSNPGRGTPGASWVRRVHRELSTLTADSRSTQRSHDSTRQ